MGIFLLLCIFFIVFNFTPIRQLVSTEYIEYYVLPAWSSWSPCVNNEFHRQRSAIFNNRSLDRRYCETLSMPSTKCYFSNALSVASCPLSCSYASIQKLQKSTSRLQLRASTHGGASCTSPTLQTDSCDASALHPLCVSSARSILSSTPTLPSADGSFPTSKSFSATRLVLLSDLLQNGINSTAVLNSDDGIYFSCKSVWIPRNDGTLARQTTSLVHVLSARIGTPSSLQLSTDLTTTVNCTLNTNSTVNNSLVEDVTAVAVSLCDMKLMSCNLLEIGNKIISQLNIMRNAGLNTVVVSSSSCTVLEVILSCHTMVDSTANQPTSIFDIIPRSYLPKASGESSADFGPSYLFNSVPDSISGWESLFEIAVLDALHRFDVNWDYIQPKISNMSAVSVINGGVGGWIGCLKECIKFGVFDIRGCNGFLWNQLDFSTNNLQIKSSFDITNSQETIGGQCTLVSIGFTQASGFDTSGFTTGMALMGGIGVAGVLRNETSNLNSSDVEPIWKSEMNFSLTLRIERLSCGSRSVNLNSSNTVDGEASDIVDVVLGLSKESEWKIGILINGGVADFKAKVRFSTDTHALGDSIRVVSNFDASLFRANLQNSSIATAIQSGRLSGSMLPLDDTVTYSESNSNFFYPIGEFDASLCPSASNLTSIITEILDFLMPFDDNLGFRSRTSNWQTSEESSSHVILITNSSYSLQESILFSQEPQLLFILTDSNKAILMNPQNQTIEFVSNYTDYLLSLSPTVILRPPSNIETLRGVNFSQSPACSVSSLVWTPLDVRYITQSTDTVFSSLKSAASKNNFNVTSGLAQNYLSSIKGSTILANRFATATDAWACLAFCDQDSSCTHWSFNAELRSCRIVSANVVQSKQVPESNQICWGGLPSVSASAMEILSDLITPNQCLASKIPAGLLNLTEVSVDTANDGIWMNDGSLRFSCELRRHSVVASRYIETPQIGESFTASLLRQSAMGLVGEAVPGVHRIFFANRLETTDELTQRCMIDCELSACRAISVFPADGFCAVLADNSVDQLGRGSDNSFATVTSFTFQRQPTFNDTSSNPCELWPLCGSSQLRWIGGEVFDVIDLSSFIPVSAVSSINKKKFLTNQCAFECQINDLCKAWWVDIDGICELRRDGFINNIMNANGWISGVRTDTCRMIQQRNETGSNGVLSLASEGRSWRAVSSADVTFLLQLEKLILKNGDATGNTKGVRGDFKGRTGNLGGIEALSRRGRKKRGNLIPVKVVGK